MKSLLAAGLLGGIVGLILGSLRMPALVRLVGEQPARAVGTNVTVGFLVGIAGLVGHRQHAIDTFADTGACTPLARAALDAVPYPADNPTAHLAKYAALGRDGVACSTCHSMVLGKDASQKVADDAQNACIAERQKVLNPGLTGLAKTFTGNCLVAEPADLYGPFEDPKKKPMEAATGMEVAHSTHVKSSEICASCHTVHLPVLHKGEIIGHTYEQATYPEWAFSSYRTGKTADGALPLGAGAKAQSCKTSQFPVGWR